jgi:hypothetical protein
MTRWAHRSEFPDVVEGHDKNPLILRSGVLAASKDEEYIVVSWFETAQERLLTMRSSFNAPM